MDPRSLASEDCWLSVFETLSAIDLMSLACVCRCFARLCGRNSHPWRLKMRRLKMLWPPRGDGPHRRCRCHLPLWLERTQEPRRFVLSYVAWTLQQSDARDLALPFCRLARVHPKNLKPFVAIRYKYIGYKLRKQFLFDVLVHLRHRVVNREHARHVIRELIGLGVNF